MLKKHVYFFHGMTPLEVIMSGLKKGGKNRKWINEERLRYVLMCEEESYPVKTLARERGIPFGTLNGWVRKYRNGGVNALNPEKLHPGKTNL